MRRIYRMLSVCLIIILLVNSIVNPNLFYKAYAAEIDTVAPSVPTNLSVVDVKTHSVTLIETGKK